MTVFPRSSGAADRFWDHTGKLITAGPSGIVLDSEPAVGDLDGDGKVELVAAAGTPGNISGIVYRWTNNSWQMAYSGPSFGAAAPSFFGFADFDGDGKADIAATGNAVRLHLHVVRPGPLEGELARHGRRRTADDRRLRWRWQTGARIGGWNGVPTLRHQMRCESDGLRRAGHPLDAAFAGFDLEVDRFDDLRLRRRRRGRSSVCRRMLLARLQGQHRRSPLLRLS